MIQKGHRTGTPLELIDAIAITGLDAIWVASADDLVGLQITLRASDPRDRPIALHPKAAHFDNLTLLRISRMSLYVLRRGVRVSQVYAGNVRRAGLGALVTALDRKADYRAVERHRLGKKGKRRVRDVKGDLVAL